MLTRVLWCYTKSLFCLLSAAQYMFLSSVKRPKWSGQNVHFMTDQEAFKIDAYISFWSNPTVPSLTSIYHSPPFFSLTYRHCLKCRVIANKLVNEEAILRCQRREDEYSVVFRILHKICQLFFDLFQKVALISFSVPSIQMQKHLLLNSSPSLKAMRWFIIQQNLCETLKSF